ncbi:MAG: hypothetical protein JWO06_3919, partial [Bacteroidota bacterium]|nr:hypothetical protein [Bacteroidota bacterium]
VIITNDSIKVSGLFHKRELDLKSIKGFTRRNISIFLHPQKDSAKNIRIGVYIEKYQEVKAWLAENFHDLDYWQEQREEQQILENESFGGSLGERTEKLKRARQITKALNIAAIFLMLWVYFFSEYAGVLCLLCLIFPIVAIITYRHFKGMIRFNNPRGSAYPALSVAIMLPPLALFYRTANYYNEIDTVNIDWPALLICGFYTGALAYKRKEFLGRGSAFIFVFTVFIGLAYGYSVSVFYNCYFDRSVPKIYNTAITGKYVTSGYISSYHLIAKPWLAKSENVDITVPRYVYDDIDSGKVISVYQKEGKMNYRWFYIFK